MMRHGLRRLNARREDTVIVGDRMDTDIVAGMESEIETVLVLSGVTSLDDLGACPYRPKHILEGVFEIAEGLPAEGSSAQTAGGA
jgi:NagD protein